MKKYFAFITFMTIIVFVFTNTDNHKTKNISTLPLIKIQCQNTAIPNFTLHHETNLTKSETITLCHCIESTLVGWEKETALKLTTGKEDEINAVHLAGFRGIFGKRINECSKKKLNQKIMLSK